MNDYAFRAAKTTATAMLLLGVYVYFAIQPAYLEAADWNTGDVFLGVANFGTYQVRAPDGTLKESLTKGEGFTYTGCAFDSDGNLYTTNFDLDISSITKYDGADPHAASPFGSGYSAPESIVFDAFGQVYVGNRGKTIAGVDIGGSLLQFDPTGTIAKTIIETRIDFFDIAADQETILYTQEGNHIKRVSISGTSLSNFTTGTATQAFAIRILPDGGALLADRGNVKRYDSAGVVIQTYDVVQSVDTPDEDSWFSLNLDPNGTSFWSGNFETANYYKFNIATGALEIGPINTGTGKNTLFGLCVKGEITAALPPENPLLNHFLSYDLKAPKGEAKFVKFDVQLEDQFQAGLFSVEKRKKLLNPVDKNGEGILDPETHLVSYKVKQLSGQFKAQCIPCKGGVTSLTLRNNGDGAMIVVTAKNGDVVFNDFVAGGAEFSFTGTGQDGKLGKNINITVGGVVTSIHTSCSQPIGPGLVVGDFTVVEGDSAKGGQGICPLIELEDQFGKLIVGLKKPERLLLPASKDLSVVPDPLDPVKLDHFLCYKIKETPKFPKKTIRVELADQFIDPNNNGVSKSFDVEKPTRLCAPVSKSFNGDDVQIQDPDSHLTCYKIKPAKLKPPQPKHDPVEVFLNDQFGEVERWEAKKVKELCIPSTKTILTP